MRGFAAFVAGLLGVVAFAIALPLAWVAVELADEDGYVTFSRGILDDPDTRTAVVDAVVDELDGQTRQQLIDLGVPESLIDRTLEEVSGVVAQGLASEAVVDAWGESQRQAHRQMFSGESGDRGFVVELAPLVGAVAAQADVDLDVPPSLPVESTEPQAQRAVSAITASPQTAVLAGVVAVIGVAVAIAAARRRGVALAWLGLGALLATAALHLAARVATATEPAAGTGAGARVGLVLIDLARASFDDLLRTAAIGSGVALVVGLLLTAAGSISRRRGPTAGP